MCALFERVITAEGTKDINVEEVAASAMAAVESAVKDEVEAAAVVEATQRALEATLKELQVGSTRQANVNALSRPVAAAIAGTSLRLGPRWALAQRCGCEQLDRR